MTQDPKSGRKRVGYFDRGSDRVYRHNGREARIDAIADREVIAAHLREHLRLYDAEYVLRPIKPGWMNRG